MKPKVYLETSFPSYLTSRASRDVTVAGRQQDTHDWWNVHRVKFDVLTSDLVVLEAGAGDPAAASDRLKMLKTIAVLNTTREAIAMAKTLLDSDAVPQKASDDALHIAIAATNGIDYLLTWNCRHIANAVLRSKIDDVCRSLGYRPVVICTPTELMGIQTP